MSALVLFGGVDLFSCCRVQPTQGIFITAAAAVYRSCYNSERYASYKIMVLVMFSLVSYCRTTISRTSTFFLFLFSNLRDKLQYDPDSYTVVVRGVADLYVCVCVLHIKPFFYSSTSSTPSVRTDSSP